MKKKVWILNHYAGNMYLVGGGRHYYMAKGLKQSGYNPIVFCSNFDHFTKNNCCNIQNQYEEKVETKTEVPYVFVKTREYENNGIMRIFNILDFYKGVLRIADQYAKEKGKPDIIYASSVHPLTLVAGIKLAKHFGVKCISEVRDLWPESIVAYSKKITQNNILIKALYAGEKWIYKKSDALIFTMEGGYDYILERGWSDVLPKSKVYYINNGIDLHLFDENKNSKIVKDPDLTDSSFFNVVYAGSIRKVNNLNKLLDVAKRVTNKRIRFLIWGDGGELPQLKERVSKEGIINVVFKGYIEKDKIPYITSNADVNIAHNDSSPLFRFGISFNKIFDYLAAGKPILCDFYSNYNPAIQVGGGISVDSGYEDEIARKIDEISLYSIERLQEIGQKSRNGAEQYDYSVLTSKLINIIEDLY